MTIHLGSVWPALVLSAVGGALIAVGWVMWP